MTPDLTDLARRAVACQGWMWTPGMLTVVPPAHDGSTGYMLRISSAMDQPPARAYPDLTDSATLGCLLALVREARGNPTGFVVPERDGNWTYYTRLYDADYWTGGSEAEALVYALVAPRG